MFSVSQQVSDCQRNAWVRAGFVAQGSSLNAWCIANGVDPNNARKALIGKWVGPKASILTERLERASAGEQVCPL